MEASGETVAGGQISTAAAPISKGLCKNSQRKENMKADSFQRDQCQPLEENTLEMLQRKLQDKDHSLQVLHKECQDMEKQLDEKDELIADLRKSWVKTAKELDRFRANSQGFYQITDDYLTDQISHMRLVIRDFAIQYFDGRYSLRHGSRFSGPNYLDHLKSISDYDYHHYTQSPAKCHQAVQAFIWRVIVAEVFCTFEWIGQEFSKHFRHVWRGLAPPRRSGPQGQVLPPDAETERKVQTWRATTTALFLENTDSDKAESHVKLRSYRHTQAVINTLRDLIKRTEEHELRAQLLSIFTLAFALDKEISRQPGLVCWQFPDIRQTNVPKRGELGLVTSPAVIKRGKSTGKDFSCETTLLKAEIEFKG